MTNTLNKILPLLDPEKTKYQIHSRINRPKNILYTRKDNTGKVQVSPTNPTPTSTPNQKRQKQWMHTRNKTMEVTFEQDYRPVCYGQKKTNCSFDSTCLFRLLKLIFKRQSFHIFKPDFFVFS